MVGIDLSAIRHALAIARREGYDEVDLEIDGVAFSARLGSAPAAPTGATEAALNSGGEHLAETLAEIVAPVVGYYKVADKRLKVGAKVKPAQVLAIVTALGLDNEVESMVSGSVAEVLVEPGQAVEYGQVLARIEVKP